MLQVASANIGLSGAPSGEKPLAFDDVSLVPVQMRRPADSLSVAQLMRQLLDIAAPRSDAEALRLLRQSFPSAPLSARVDAIAGRAR